MSLQYHVSDLHIGHGAICKYRPFYHASHHHWYMMCALFLTADFRNVLLNHGDSVFVDRYDDVLRNIYSMYEKVVEMGGNHCYEKIPMKRKFFMDLDNVELQAFYKKYNAWMSHAPVHTSELRARMKFHGHVHDDSIPDPMYINCCMESEFMEYWPKNHQELLAIAAKRSDRETSNGCVLVKSVDGFAAMVAVKCETDFVAAGKDFVELVQNILDAAIAAKAKTLEEVKALKLANGDDAESAVQHRSGISGE